MDHYAKLKEAGYVGETLGHGKNGYGLNVNFFGLLLSTNMKQCFAIDKKGALEEKLTLEGFHHQKKYLKLTSIST